MGTDGFKKMLEAHNRGVRRLREFDRIAREHIKEGHCYHYRDFLEKDIFVHVLYHNEWHYENVFYVEKLIYGETTVERGYMTFDGQRIDAYTEISEEDFARAVKLMDTFKASLLALEDRILRTVRNGKDKGIQGLL